VTPAATRTSRRATASSPRAFPASPSACPSSPSASSSTPAVDLARAAPTRSTLAGERGARRALLGQIASLERELVEQRCSTWPRAMAAAGPARSAPHGARGGPRLLSLEALELLRDQLVETLSAERKALADRTLAEEESRRLREELVLDPAAHPGACVTNAEVGESGCGAVRSEPAGGLLGMLMGWWRVVVSSGCP
jgi:hypothetical protein